MAATTSKKIQEKTNVYWTKDPDTSDSQFVKVHIPGVATEPAVNIKEPMVKKPVKLRKPHMITLQQNSRLSMMNMGGVGRRRLTSAIDETPTHDVTSVSDKVSPKKASLKDLGPEDKKRVANLVKELAKVGEEREIALTQLTQERIAFEERLQILQEEYDSNIKEKLNLQSRFLELQGLLKKYNKQESDRLKERSINATQTHLNHTTQTSPRPESPSKQPQDIPGNVRYLPGKNKSPKKTIPKTKQSVQEDIQQPSATDCQLSSPKNMSRQSTPLPGKQEGEGSIAVPGNGTINTDTSRSENKSIKSKAFISESLASENITRIPPTASVQQATGLDLRQAPVSSSAPGTSASTSMLLPNHTPSPTVLRNKPSSPQVAAQNVPGLMVPGNPVQGVGRNLPSYHFLGNIPPPLGSSLFPQGSQWPPLYRHPPSKSSEHDPPVYTNRSFDVSMTRPDAMRQGTTTTNRSQSGPSQSFSAELDAVYRLYCREYELQLQLQQQQLELQKQQLQLQHQLQQLEFFQQRQQQQKPPRSSTQTIIRETPDPTPAPKPEVQPQRASALSDLIPTPDESCNYDREQLSTIHHQKQGCLTERDDRNEEDEANKTIRRITSSKRPKKSPKGNPNVPYHEGSYTSTNHLPGSRSRGYSSISHNSINVTDVQGLVKQSSGVSKEIIHPQETARFRFSLHGDKSSLPDHSQKQSISHSTRLDNEVDWTNATDFEFRQMQESKIRQHYGLGQRLLNSSQVPIDPFEPRVTGARYNLYEAASVAEPVDRRIESGYAVEQERDSIHKRNSGDRHPCDSDTDRRYSDRQPSAILIRREINEDQELEERTLQNFSLYENTNGQIKGARGRASYYGDSKYRDSREDVEPWVSESSTYQKDRSHSLDLNYPFEIIDLVQDLENEPTISPQPNKPNYTVYLTPPRHDQPAQNEVLDSTDSGFSNVSREKSPLVNYSRGSEDEIDIEELSVLEDIFFIR